MSPHPHLYCAFLKVSLATSLRIMHILAQPPAMPQPHLQLSRHIIKITTGNSHPTSTPPPSPTTTLSGCHQLARLTQSAVIKLCIAQSLPKICKALQQSMPSRGYKGGEGGLHCSARLIAIREASANCLATPQVFKELRRA